MKTTIALIAVLAVGIVAFVALSGSNDTNTNATSNANTNLSVTNNTNTSMEKNIVETAVAAGNFTTLVTAVQTAGLVETLSSDGPFTVFAPTDEAFAKLGETAIAELLKDKERLTQILTYHVVPQQALSSELTDGQKLTTVEGKSLTVDSSTNGVLINTAKVTQADIKTSNGVIHVIDSVLLP